MPKSLTSEERWKLADRGKNALARAMQEKTDSTYALIDFCRFMSDGGEAPARTQEVLALCLLCHAFHTSRCRDNSLPNCLKIGWKLFRRMSAMRAELLRIASAAAGTGFLRRIPTCRGARSGVSCTRRGRAEPIPVAGSTCRGEVWDNDIIDMASMDSYPQVMPDDLFILSADGGKLALWRATK